MAEIGLPFKRDHDGYIPLKRSADDVLELVKKEDVKFIDLQFADLPGRMQHNTIPVDQLEAGSFSAGIPKLDGSSIRGFAEIHESDFVMVPDPSTFAILPWIPQHIKTARLLCNIFMEFGTERFSRDPRFIAQRAEQRLIEEGYTLSYWGPEIEFFVFDKVSWDVLRPFHGQSYQIESREAAWGVDNRYPIRFKEGYYPAPPQDTLTEYRSECATILTDCFGIVCDAHHHEVATAGQCEIDMYRDTLTNMADNVMTYKFVTKNIAAKQGMVATMMPKPIFGDNASGMHTSVSIWKDGVRKRNPSQVLELVERPENNLFYDPNDTYAELSQLGRYFAGGLEEHSHALVAMVAPTTNSYRRLVPGYEAPVYVAWSRRNRSANVRIPVYQKGPEAAKRKRIEFRTPDTSCNPYLCFAAMLAAGLDGIKKKTDPGDPTDEDIYKMTPERRRALGIKQLPGSLKEAIECLESDRAFLKPIFTDDVIDRLIEIEQSEYDQVSMRPHPFEFYLYFDI